MNSAETIGKSGTTKIDRYKWKVRDEVGELSWLSKGLIDVDLDYQRNTNQAKVLDIARNWSWVACGTITVADRDGTFYAIDGQHRVAAARLRSDITNLPCVIFKVDGVRAEAEGFLAANTGRKPLTGIDKYRAKILTADEATVALSGLLDRAGYTVRNSSDKATAKAVAMFAKLAARDLDALNKVFMVFAEDLDHAYAHEISVTALWFLESGQHVDLLDRRTRARIRSLGAGEILVAAKRASAYYARGGEAVWAEGVTNALNKGMRKPISTYVKGAE